MQLHRLFCYSAISSAIMRANPSTTLMTPAGGYVDGDTLTALKAAGLDVFDVLQNNDAYHALKAVDGLIVTGPTGTNVNDVAVALLH